MIKIIVDSICDRNPDLFRDYDVAVLPLTITIEDKNYLDGEEISVEEVYEQMRRGIYPKTAQIPYERIESLFRSYCEEGHDFIYLPFSSEMSGCCALAKTVADDLRAEFPERKMEVLDSRSGAGAIEIIALQALKLIERGVGFEELVEHVTFMIDHVEHVFCLADLLWLAKGGRISVPVGYVGNMLSIHPILDMEDGKLVVIKMVRGNKKAVKAVMEKVKERIGTFTDQLIAISHAGDWETARQVEQMVREAFPNCRTAISQVGGVLGVHLGIGGIGVLFFREKPPAYIYD